jgi:modulator of FtsH protease HflK
MAWNEPGKGRDPWGGGNGRDSGGPDMDQMVRNIQRKLGGMFGGGGGGRGEAGGVFGIVVLALVAFLAYDMIHIVQPGERGVVLRFGAHVATLEAGPAIRLPRPIERVIKVNVEEVSQYSHKALMLTQDENIVDVELAVQYRRVNAADYLFNLVGPDVTLGQAAESAVREIAGKTTMDFILGAGRAEVAQATQQLMQEIVDQYESGITILSVNLVDAQPPEPVQAAFADAIKAREDQERIINEAHAYANDVVPRARGASARVLEEANAYREGMIARATGESDRFLQVLTEYERAPEVTRERLYIEAVEEVLAGSHKVLIDLEGSGNLMVLPLDQIMRQVSGAATPMADPDGQRDARARAAAAETREREAARSRRAP